MSENQNLTSDGEEWGRSQKLRYSSGESSPALKENRSNKEGLDIYLDADYMVHKVRSVEKDTKVYSKYLSGKIFRNYFIFLPPHYLIVWLMTAAKNFEKVANLKI